MQSAKTIAAFHDLSGVGRCSLTVAIPVISAMGVQVYPAPTAVLSAHTAYPDFTAMDLTDYLDACVRKWDAMALKPDCVYTGYFANIRQEEIARRFMAARPQALRVIDPVLGDDGEMYVGMPARMPEKLKTLCAEADVITPNLTETALLTGLPYLDRAYSLREVEERLDALMTLKPKRALITGVPIDGARANVWTDGKKVHFCRYEQIPAVFPGTGDLFASVLAGALTRGEPFEQALALATRYVRETMRVTVACGSHPLEGVQLENTLKMLMPRRTSREAAVVAALRARGETVTFAESCTGGALAARLIDVSGASAVIGQSYVTYCNDAKMRLLGVRPETIDRFTEVSSECAEEMAEGARASAGTDWAVSATGYAGPDGGTAEHPVGTVFLGIAGHGKRFAVECHFLGSREDVRAQAVDRALSLLEDMLTEADA